MAFRTASVPACLLVLGASAKGAYDHFYGLHQSVEKLKEKGAETEKMVALELQPLSLRVGILQADMHQVKADMRQIKEDMHQLKAEMHQIKADMVKILEFSIKKE
ncbi:hypothetical protein Agub_g12461 [Astrephomene gubernaculifera]|uniref:Uncharacterized protein n=1 Tax=Astrephomene gubernaculifera TaxID=47775 RepID=A0AAD3E0A2_9CHLO|nr:hypothetical protein Agub_g12461 [Astrephomene gubernaculifera]